MRIATNTSSLFLQRQLSQNVNGLGKTMQKLSSGLRINTAADDAAGLQISNRLTSQVRGTAVAMRNANDAISVAQTAEGALQQVTTNLHRIRDLSLQAMNGTYSRDDRASIQEEVNQLLSEIDRINETTSFGGKQVFTVTGGAVLDIQERDIVKGLAQTWLAESEKIILEQLGINGQNASLKIDLEHVDGAGGTAAYVSAGVVAGVEAINQVMVIDLDDFSKEYLPNGDPTSLELDETILHEMVHAVQGANFEEWSTITAWFKEGSAEYIRGADDRVEVDIANQGGATRSAQIANLWTATQAEQGSTAVVSTEGAYSGGYIIMRYMRDQLGQQGIIDLNNSLADGNDLDTALSEASGGRWANEAAVFTELNGAATDPDYATVFEEFIETKMSFTDNDNGAAGGFGVDGLERRENTMSGYGLGSSGAKYFVESFVSGDDDFDNSDFDPNNYDTTLLDGVNEVRLGNYETAVFGGGGSVVQAQIGANSFETIDFSLGAISTENLGIDYIDILDHPGFAVIAMDDALRIVDSTRAQLGAAQNRLSKTISNLSNVNENASASRARIRDADFAFETMELTKNQIKQQAASTLLAQANQFPQLALSLLA